MEFRDEPGFGCVAVATKQYTAGEVVIKEDALLEVPAYDAQHPQHEALEKYAKQHGVEPAVVLKLQGYLAAPPDVRAQAQQLYCPDTALTDHHLIGQASGVIDVLLAHPPSPAFGTQAAEVARDELLRALLIWLVNGHAFFAGTALFSLGSRLTHTCGQPNTAYRTFGSTTHQATHYALRNIEPGEILTSNYLGWDHHALQSAPACRHHLQAAYAFLCKCPNCVSRVDTLRAIPCPKCSTPYRTPDRLLTLAAALHPVPDPPPPPGTPPIGYLLCNRAQLLAEHPTPWQCDTCEATYPDTLEALWGTHYHRGYRTVEATLERFAVSLDSCLDRDPHSGDPEKTWKRMTDVAQVLGPRHWATIRIMFTALRVLTTEVGTIAEQHLGLISAGRQEGLSPDFQGEALKFVEQLMEVSGLLWEVLDKHIDVDAAQLLCPYFTAAAKALSQLAGCGFLGAQDGAGLARQAAGLLEKVAGAAVGPASGVGDTDGRRGEVMSLIRRMQQHGLGDIEEGDEEEADLGEGGLCGEETSVNASSKN